MELIVSFLLWLQDNTADNADLTSNGSRRDASYVYVVVNFLKGNSLGGEQRGVDTGLPIIVDIFATCPIDLFRAIKRLLILLHRSLE